MKRIQKSETTAEVFVEVKLQRTPRPRNEEKKESESVRDEELQQTNASLKAILTRALVGGGTIKMPRLRLYLYLGVGMSVNSVAGKYKQVINGLADYGISNVSNSAEWASLGAIFDEFFVHSMTLNYHPINKYSASTTASTTAAGSPGFINTLGCVIYGLQHNQQVYTDSSTCATAAMSSALSRWVNLGDSFRFKWKNVERFDPDGTLGDQTTADSTQAWCSMNAAPKYGGTVGFATFDASGASAGIGALLENGQFGQAMLQWDISFRVRS